MALPISSVGGATPAAPTSTASRSFSDFMKRLEQPSANFHSEVFPHVVVDRPASRHAAAGTVSFSDRFSSPSERVAGALERIDAAQQRIDQVLKLAQSGQTFSPTQLLTLQADVYRSSQQLDLAGKVVDKATSGVKQILQTQV